MFDEEHEDEDDLKQEKEDEEREKTLGFRPQSEVVFNKLLPYSAEIDAESNDALALIKLNLPKAVLAKELRPGVTHWTRQLTKYIRLYGMKFSKEDHILYIKLYLELIAIPTIEGSLVETFLAILIKLLKKRKLLSRSDLVIEWRPLYLLMKRLLYSKLSEAGLEWFPATVDTNLKSVILLCSVYFPLSSTQEILDEFKPLLCPYDVTVNEGLKYMDWFLPTVAVTEEERDCSWRLWFKEFFTFWESTHNGPIFESHLIIIFARLGLHNVGHVDWGPHCSKIFTRLLRIFRLPVGKQNNTSMVSVSSSLQNDSIPRWIVAMLGGPSSHIVLDHIESMFMAIKSYYYPSNNGSWTQGLLTFLSSLTFKFVNRIHNERYKKETWEGKTPESYRLTDEEITRFVLIIKPAAFLALYSKLGTSSASRVLQFLATVRPELILPELLEKSYTALETLTEPHQLKGCLSALVSCMRPMMRYSKWYIERRSHVIPILFRALPTIDSNDMPKSLLGINFITTCFSLMPIADCSELIKDYPDMTENERNLCLATAELPDFVIQYLDRVFTVIESLNQGHSTQAVESGNDVELKWTMQESVFMGGIASSVAVILIQSSDEIYERSMDKIFRFMSTRILDGVSSIGAVMHLCAAMAKAKPGQAAKKFIPYFAEETIGLFNENPHLHEEEKADHQLQWNLVVLTGICKHCGKHALNYKSELTNVLKLALNVKAKLVYQQACTLGREILSNLTNFSQTDYSSVNPSCKNEKLPIYNWGRCTTPWRAEMSWHEPSEEEINFAFEIVEEFLFVELDSLQDFSKGDKDLSKDELLRSLSIVYDFTVGIAQLLPDSNAKVVEIKERDNVSELLSWSAKTISYTKQYKNLLQEKGELITGLRERIFNIVRSTLWTVMEKKEDDVKSISVIISIYAECLRFHEVYKSEFDKHWAGFINGKRGMRDALRGGKRHQRLLIVDRALLQHQMRTLALDRTEYTEITHNAMLDLLKLSMSHYSAVRISAQRTFFRGLKLTPYKSEEYFLPPVLEALKKDPIENHKLMKGALYLMLGAGGRTSSYLAYLHEWSVISRSWPAIIKAMKSDKPSIVKLYDKLSVKIQSTYNTIAIDIEVNEASFSVAKQILNSSSEPKVRSTPIEGVDERVHARCQENLRLYNKLVSELLQLLENGDLSWLQKNFTSACLNFVIRWDSPLHQGIASHVTSGLIDDTVLFRQLCIAPVTSILKKQERKRKVIYKTPEEISGVKARSGSVTPGDRPDNKWMQYDSSNLPTTAEKYDSTIFIEKTHWGYYQWPKKLKTYALKDDSYKLDRTREEMPDDEKELFDKFSDPDFVKQLLKYNSLENVKGSDRYDTKRVELYKGLFRNFGDSFLHIFQPEIEELAKDVHESSQRCVAEFIAGLVIGSKHWNFDKVDAMWKWLIPILQTTMDNISVETSRDWFQACGHIVQNRDPRKLHWFLEFLMKELVSGRGGSFMDASRLSLLLGGVRQQEWRVAELLQRQLSNLEPILDHQYKIVRDKMGSILSNIFLYDVSLNGNHDFFSPKRDSFIERILQRLSPLSKEGSPHIATKSSDTDIKPSGSRMPDFPMFEISDDVMMSQVAAAPSDIDIGVAMETDMPENTISQLQQGLQKMLASAPFSGKDKELVLKQFFQHQQQYLPPGVTEETIKNLVFDRRPLSGKNKSEIRDDMDATLDDSVHTFDKERNLAVRLLKTLMKFIICGQKINLQPTKPCIWTLLPLICKMSPVDTQGPDEELHHDTQVSLSCLAQNYTPPDHLRLVVDTINQISDLPSWHARYTVLKFSQVFIFNNLFTLRKQEDCMEIFKEVILKLIADEQLEVREMATKTLGGLLQCGFMTIDKKLEDFISKNCKLPVKQKRKEKLKDAGKIDYQIRLRNRHAGVLALSACILCSPYSIPEHLPDLLMKLSNHLHDPQPIEGTVKKTFSEFRRTHHDSWHLDKLKFTSDQLSILTDLLVSPCYYA